MSGIYAIESTRELIKQYLNSVRTFSKVLAKEKGEQFEVDSRAHVEKVVSEVVRYIETYDIDSLVTVWEYFNTHLFNRLNEIETKTLTKLEADVFKLYLVNCVQNKKQDKCVQFFEKMTSQISNNSLWTDWYALPYVPDPANDKRFANYFCKTFHEILLVSLHNFIAVSLTKLCQPPLVSLGGEDLMPENPTLQDRTDALMRLRSGMMDLFMDDFSIIARSSEKPKPKPTIKTMLKSFTNRKSSES